MAVVGRAISQVKHGFYGWRVVGLMMGPRAGASGAVINGNSLFIIPLEESLGMSRGLVSILFTLGGMVGAVSAPLGGVLIDRFGSRKVLLASILVFATGFLLFSQADSVLIVFVVYLGVISLGFEPIAYSGSTVVVNAWFNKYKTTAMAVLTVGTALGGLVIVPILAVAIDVWGWRVAAALAALIVLLVGLPAVVFTRNTPEEMGYQPDGIGGRATHALPSPKALTAGLSTLGAMRTRSFWMLTGAVVCFGTTMVTIQIHFVPIMVWKGLDEVDAALLVGLRSFLSIPVVLTIGWLGDRFTRVKVAAVVVTLLGAGVVVLEVGNAVWTYWIAVLLMAGSIGLYPLMWSTVGDTFGRRSFATLRGIITALQVLGIVGMPIMAGFIFDWTGAYTWALWPIVVLAGLSATFMLLTPRNSYTSAATEAPAGRL